MYPTLHTYIPHKISTIQLHYVSRLPLCDVDIVLFCDIISHEINSHHFLVQKTIDGSYLQESQVVMMSVLNVMIKCKIAS